MAKTIKEGYLYLVIGNCKESERGERITHYFEDGELVECIYSPGSLRQGPNPRFVNQSGLVQILKPEYVFEVGEIGEDEE